MRRDTAVQKNCDMTQIKKCCFFQTTQNLLLAHSSKFSFRGGSKGKDKEKPPSLVPAPELFIRVTFPFFCFKDFGTMDVCTKCYSIYTIKSVLVADGV